MATARNSKDETAAPAVDEVIDTGFRVSEDVAKSNAEAARKGFEAMVSMGREALDTAARAGGDNSVLEGVTEMRRANFEAMVEAGDTLIKGIEGLNGRVFEIARRQVADGAETQKALFGARTFGEAVEIQQCYMRKAFDNVVRDGMDMTSAWFRVATESGQPIGRRVSDAWSKAAQQAG